MYLIYGMLTHRHVQAILSENYSGTIVSDGYAAYSRFAQHNDVVTHAQFRVGRDITAPTPHRPGRAQLTHPVPHEAVSLRAA